MVKSVAIALLVAVVATSIVGPSSDHNDLVLINCMGVPSTSKLDNLVPELHNLFSFNANCSILVHFHPPISNTRFSTKTVISCSKSASKCPLLVAQISVKSRLSPSSSSEKEWLPNHLPRFESPIEGVRMNFQNKIDHNKPLILPTNM